MGPRVLSITVLDGGAGYTDVPAVTITHPTGSGATATAVLDAQVARWNQGDLEGFVATYWNGPELTFYGKGGLTRGRKDLLATYQRSYPTAKERGLLSFEVVEFAPLGTAHALVLGRYRIVGEAPSEGVFSLVLGVQNGAVVILHDHTTGTALK